MEDVADSQVRKIGEVQPREKLQLEREDQSESARVVVEQNKVIIEGSEDAIICNKSSKGGLNSSVCYEFIYKGRGKVNNPNWIQISDYHDPTAVSKKEKGRDCGNHHDQAAVS